MVIIFVRSALAAKTVLSGFIKTLQGPVQYGFYYNSKFRNLLSCNVDYCQSLPPTSNICSVRPEPFGVEPPCGTPLYGKVPGLSFKYQTMVIVTSSVTHASLLRYGINNCCEKFFIMQLPGSILKKRPLNLLSVECPFELNLLKSFFGFFFVVFLTKKL
jgi:hypothetical protein